LTSKSVFNYKSASCAIAEAQSQTKIRFHYQFFRLHKFNCEPTLKL